MSQKRHAPDDEPHFLVRSMSVVVPDGRALNTHAHPWGQLLFATSGVVSVWTTEGSWVAPPQWAVWAAPRVAHAIRVTGRATLSTLYLRPSLDGLPARSAVVPVTPLLRELAARVTEVGMLDDRDPVHVAIATLIREELRTHDAPPLDLQMPGAPRLRRVAEHIASAPGDRTSHAALARRFGLGIRTLERGFVQETGLSLGRWRRQARLLHALRRLGAGAQVKAVAEDAGYRSASAFVAAFRVALHTTPGRYFGAGPRPDWRQRPSK